MSDERYVIRAPKVDLNQLSRGRANMPEALKQMGFSSMRQGQADVISCIMAGRDTICVLPTACHAKGQGILMADGSVKKVENIVVGDCVMGWDGTSRRVTHLKHGKALCSRITPQDGGAPYVVTDQHLLTLVFESRGRDEFTLADPGWAITDMSVENYRTLTTASKAAWRGVRAMTHPACGSPVRYKAHGIRVMPVGIQEFFGFTITGDGRYLMDDFTVTHNTGKTACFVLPTLALEWRTLVFSPLISLMRDQVQSLAAKGVRVGSLTSHDPAMNDQYIKAWLRGEIQVLYVAPERLRRDDFLHAMRQVPPDFVVMDEAHCLSSWSDNFRSAYCVVGDFIRDMNPNVVATFTATCPPEVELDIRRVMCIQKAIKTTYYPRRNNLDLRSQPFPGEPGLATLLERVNGPSVIYCASVKRVEQLAKDLGNLTGKEVHFYHGQLPKAQRSHTQDMFARGEAQWMVATNAFGMGVDVPNIRLVVHFDVSDSIEGLAQEAGRGGRDGKHTLCMAYDNKDTVGVRNFLIRMSNPDPSEVEDIYEAMLKNCDTSGRVTVSVDELCKRAGLRVVSRIGAILQILGGSLVIDRKRDDEKRGMVKWLNRVDDPKLQRYMDAARLLGEPEQDGFISVDLISWADHLGVGDASLKSFLRDKTAAHILDYIPPDRAAPIKVIGDKRLINFERIQERQDRALTKFGQVLRYAREIPDKDKHSYIEAMLGMDSSTLGATQPAQ